MLLPYRHITYQKTHLFNLKQISAIFVFLIKTDTYHFLVIASIRHLPQRLDRNSKINIQ